MCVHVHVCVLEYSVRMCIILSACTCTYTFHVLVPQVAQVAAKTLGVPLDLIKVKPTNTLIGPNDITTGGSVTSELCCLVRQLHSSTPCAVCVTAVDSHIFMNTVKVKYMLIIPHTYNILYISTNIATVSMNVLIVPRVYM